MLSASSWFPLLAQNRSDLRVLKSFVESSQDNISLPHHKLMMPVLCPFDMSRWNLQKTTKTTVGNVISITCFSLQTNILDIDKITSDLMISISVDIDQKTRNVLPKLWTLSTMPFSISVNLTQFVSEVFILWQSWPTRSCLSSTDIKSNFVKSVIVSFLDLDHRWVDKGFSVACRKRS